MLRNPISREFYRRPCEGVHIVTNDNNISNSFSFKRISVENCFFSTPYKVSIQISIKVAITAVTQQLYSSQYLRVCNYSAEACEPRYQYFFWKCDGMKLIISLRNKRLLVLFFAQWMEPVRFIARGINSHTKWIFKKNRNENDR